MRACLFLLLLALAWQSDVAASTQPQVVDAPGKAQDDAWQTRQAARIIEGDRLLAAKQPEQAIRDAFAPLIADYEARYASSDTLYYCARTSAEGLAYMVHVAAAHDRSGQGKNAVLLDQLWAYGYYGKAYALIELNRPDEATEALEKALALSPYNPQFLSERGHLYQMRKDWPEMLRSNLSAEEFAGVGSPDYQRNKEHARALRGQGFALIELDRLQEAESRFLESLELEPDSQNARNELLYIEQLKRKSLEKATP